MRRVALLLLGLVAVLALVSQLALPPLLESAIRDRLEEEGGSAEVSLSALPALRLLFADGESLEVEGRGLRVRPERRPKVLDRLDGFDRVHVRLSDVDAEPLEIRTFVLTREGDSGYAVRMAATTSPREVARFLGSRAGGALGGLVGDLAAGTLPGGGATPVPMAIDADVRRRDGRAEVMSAQGSVAGIPAGPLVQIVVDAVVRQL